MRQPIALLVGVPRTDGSTTSERRPRLHAGLERFLTCLCSKTISGVACRLPAPLRRAFPSVGTAYTAIAQAPEPQRGPRSTDFAIWPKRVPDFALSNTQVMANGPSTELWQNLLHSAFRTWHGRSSTTTPSPVSENVVCTRANALCSTPRRSCAL